MKDRLVSPGILGLAAAAGAFVLAYNVWWIHAYVDPRPELSSSAATLLELFFNGLGLVIAFFGGLSLIGIWHRVSGSVVFAGSLLTGLIVIPGALVTSNLVEELILAGYLSCSALGIIGGLKGIYWGRSWRNGAAVPELAEYSRWVLIGGFALLIDAPWREPESLAFLASMVVPISGALVYKGIGNRRLLALLIIAAALWASTSFWLQDAVIRVNYGFDYMYTRGYTFAEILGFAGAVLSVIAGVKIWTSKGSKIPAPKQ